MAQDRYVGMRIPPEVYMAVQKKRLMMLDTLRKTIPPNARIWQRKDPLPYTDVLKVLTIDNSDDYLMNLVKKRWRIR